MENRIKERLTGALILVAALVVLVPEIFSGRRASEPRQETPAAAPASEGPPLRTYTAELDAKSTQPLAQADAQSPAAKAPASEPQASTANSPATPPAAAQPQVVAEPQKPTAQPPAAAAADSSADGDWFVQVGSFSQAANAQRYAQQLRAQGYAAIVLPPVGGKTLSRVRVGPARTREAAAALQERLATGGHKGAVVGP